MRGIDYFLRVLGIIAFFGSFILPHNVSWKLMCLWCFSVGLWAVLFPPGILGWADRGRRQLDPTDPSLWWIPRLIGTALIASALVLAIAFFKL